MVATHRTRAKFTIGGCRRCGAHELHTSRPRSIFERLVVTTSPFAPTRCPACGERKLRHRASTQARPAPAPEDLAPISRRERRRRRKIQRAVTALSWLGGTGLVFATLAYICMSAQ